MNDSNEPHELHHVIAAQKRGDDLILVYLSYWEDDAANAVGQIVRTTFFDRQGSYESILNTNDVLTPTLWCSPTNNLWVGSANGNVWTTAHVAWPPHRMAGLVYDVRDATLSWTVTTLPDLKQLGHKPNVSALWGIGDANVFIGTFTGGIYHWNGTEWLQVFEAVGEPINHIHGSAENDVYAVGNKGTILHFDGTAWRQLPYPGDGVNRDVLTGVRALNQNEAFVCGTAGRILHGSRSGFEILGQFAIPFYGITYFQNRLILASGMKGAHELRGNQVSVLRDTFGAVAIFEMMDRVFFIEPTQEPASIIDYCPILDPPWARRRYP
jgi:hypothetical protein